MRPSRAKQGFLWGDSRALMVTFLPRPKSPLSGSVSVPDQHAPPEQRLGCGLGCGLPPGCFWVGLGGPWQQQPLQHLSWEGAAWLGRGGGFLGNF